MLALTKLARCLPKACCLSKACCLPLVMQALEWLQPAVPEGLGWQRLQGCQMLQVKCLALWARCLAPLARCLATGCLGL